MKKMIVAAAWGIAVSLWIAIFIYKAVADPGLREWTAAVVAGALSLEVAFWVTAGVLGITLFESRKAVFGFLTRPFRRGDQ
ncbi:MAG TPA: hypothetical protein DDZ68_14065 [Parvularcula sp.]|nr:hypothetical protein [Parvularcula sp.]